MKNVSGSQVVTSLDAVESPLLPQIQQALGELVRAAREGLLALSVGVGLGVVHGDERDQHKHREGKQRQDNQLSSR